MVRGDSDLERRIKEFVIEYLIGFCDGDSVRAGSFLFWVFVTDSIDYM